MPLSPYYSQSRFQRSIVDSLSLLPFLPFILKPQIRLKPWTLLQSTAKLECHYFFLHLRTLGFQQPSHEAAVGYLDKEASAARICLVKCDAHFVSFELFAFAGVILCSMLEGE